jgi:hypothetical protein
MHGEYSGKMAPFNRASQRAAESKGRFSSLQTMPLKVEMSQNAALRQIFLQCVRKYLKRDASSGTLLSVSR